MSVVKWSLDFDKNVEKKVSIILNYITCITWLQRSLLFFFRLAINHFVMSLVSITLLQGYQPK